MTFLSFSRCIWFRMALCLHLLFGSGLHHLLHLLELFGNPPWSVPWSKVGLWPWNKRIHSGRNQQPPTQVKTLQHYTELQNITVTTLQRHSSLPLFMLWVMTSQSPLSWQHIGVNLDIPRTFIVEMLRYYYLFFFKNQKLSWKCDFLPSSPNNTIEGLMFQEAIKCPD